MKPPEYSNLPIRFWSKVEVKPSGCWEWTANKVNGYGRFRMDGKFYLSHRLSAQDLNGDIPRGALTLHTCDNPPCVLPKHLYFGTYQDNSNDAVRRGRQSAGQEHPPAKLTDQDVVEVRRLWSTRDYTQDEIGRTYGVTQSTISKIIRRATRKGVPQ